MIYLEAGQFFIILGFAIFFTLFAFRKTSTKDNLTAPTNAAFRLLAMALFLGLAGIIAGGYQVIMTGTSNQTIKDINTGDLWKENDTNQQIIIPGGLTSNWMAWIFGAFGFMNLIFLVKEMGIM